MNKYIFLSLLTFLAFSHSSQSMKNEQDESSDSDTVPVSEEDSSEFFSDEEFKKPKQKPIPRHKSNSETKKRPVNKNPRYSNTERLRFILEQHKVTPIKRTLSLPHPSKKDEEKNPN